MAPVLSLSFKLRLKLTESILKVKKRGETQSDRDFDPFGPDSGPKPAQIAKLRLKLSLKLTKPILSVNFLALSLN